jgi:hypothetical protein
MLQARRSQVEVLDEVDFFNLPNPSSGSMALGSSQPPTEMSTRNLPGIPSKLQMYLPVLGTPALHKTHSNGTHSCELIHGFETLTDGLWEQCRKLLVVEDFQVTAYGQDLHKPEQHFAITFKIQYWNYFHRSFHVCFASCCRAYSTHYFPVYAETAEYQYDRLLRKFKLEPPRIKKII